MKNIKNLKKKIFGITLVVGLLVLSIVGTTMAYFTDTAEKTNVFTSGNVDIEFTSDVLIDDDGNSETFTYVRPTQKLANAAVVENIGSEKAYVGIVITFTKAVDKASDLFTDLGKGNFTVEYSADNTQVFVVYNDETKKGDKITFFENITVPALWDNEDMKDVFETGLKMNVKAYATQTYGLTEGGAVAALKTAFATDWANMPAGN